MIFENTWQGETVLHEAFIDNAENNIYDIVDYMIGIMTKDQLNQVEDMLTNQYPEEAA